MRRATKGRNHKNGGSSTLIVILLLLVAITVCYLVFVKKVRIPELSDFVEKQTQVQKTVPRVDTKSPRAAFAEVGGFPRASREVDVLENTGYACGYSEDLMDPLWSAYYCGPKPVYPVGSRDKIAFVGDPRISLPFRVTSNDYKRPKNVTPTYDRGHMAPNYAIASRYGTRAQAETFLMTNIAPQRSTLNQQTWRYLEEEITDTYAPEFNGVWVIVGPVFDSPVKHYNNKAAMPDGFFCIILDRDEKTGSLRAIAMYLRQNVSGNHAPKEFLTTIRAIEKHTGLDFFSQLPDDVEERLETSAPDAEWHTAQLLIESKK